MLLDILYKHHCQWLVYGGKKVMRQVVMIILKITSMDANTTTPSFL
jgi:hypothetical protein